MLASADPLRVWLGPAGDPGSGPGDGGGWGPAPSEAGLQSVRLARGPQVGTDLPLSLALEPEGLQSCPAWTPLLPRLWGAQRRKGDAWAPDASLATVYTPPWAAGPWAPVSGLCHT